MLCYSFQYLDPPKNFVERTENPVLSKNSLIVQKYFDFIGTWYFKTNISHDYIPNIPCNSFYLFLPIIFIKTQQVFLSWAEWTPKKSAA